MAKLNLTYIGVHNEDIIRHMKENDMDTSYLEDCVNDDKEFFSRLWDNYDLVFDRDAMDELRQDIHSSSSYEKGSVKYNFVLEKIIKEFHSHEKNGHSIKQIKVWG